MNELLDRKISLPSILKFTLPTMIMMAVMSFYTVADGMFVARLVGTDAFSAVNIVYPLLSLTIGLGTMFGAGMTAIVSRKLGEGMERQACRILTFVILFSILLGGAITAVCLSFLDELVFALGANAAIFSECRSYALPLILFFTANILQFQFQNLYVANGKPHVGLAVTIAGGLTNLVLDYLFIARFHMGITGAAVATGIGYSVPALFGLFYFSLNRRGALHFVRPTAEWKALLYSAANGSSEMVSYLSASVTTFLFNLTMMRFAGSDGVAAIAIVLYLDFIILAVGLGYSLGVSPLISCYYGAGRPDVLRRIFRISVGFCTATGIFMALGTLVFARPLVLIFASEGTAVYQLAEAGIRIYAMGYLFKSFNVFSSAMFTAFGNGVVSAFLSFLRTFVLLILFLVGLSALLGITGVWAASPLTELSSAALSAACLILFGRRYLKPASMETDVRDV